MAKQVWNIWNGKSDEGYEEVDDINDYIKIIHDNLRYNLGYDIEEIPCDSPIYLSHVRATYYSKYGKKFPDMNWVVDFYRIK